MHKVSSAANLFVSSSYEMTLLFSTYISACAHTRAPRESHVVSVLPAASALGYHTAIHPGFPAFSALVGNYKSLERNMSFETYPCKLNIEDASLFF